MSETSRGIGYAAETAEQREARLQRDRGQWRSRRVAEMTIVLHV